MQKKRPFSPVNSPDCFTCDSWNNCSLLCLYHLAAFVQLVVD